MSILSTNTSISHTYGNVACVAIEYIKKLFGENFFKTIHISTRLAYRQLDIFRTKQEFFKLDRPILCLRPRIELDDSSLFLYGSSMTERKTNALTQMEFMATQELFKHDKSMLRYGLNRLKVTYDMVIILDSMNQQLNVSHAIHNMVVPNRPFMIPTPLEAYIPKNIIYPLCEFEGIDVTDTASVLKYLNSNSRFPITYKLKNSSGNDEFFCLYNTNIETIMSPMSLDDGSRRGMLQDTFTITFSMSCEFYGVGAYHLFLKDDKDNASMCGIDDDLLSMGDRIYPLFTIPLLYDIQLDEGWKIYQSPAITRPAMGEDVTDISSMFDSALCRIIEHQTTMNIPLDIFIKFKVYEGTRELQEGRDFIVDIPAKKFILKNADTRLTYRLFILINNYIINSMTMEITGFDKSK